LKSDKNNTAAESTAGCITLVLLMRLVLMEMFLLDCGRQAKVYRLLFKQQKISRNIVSYVTTKISYIFSCQWIKFSDRIVSATLT